jgi:hypothetical protein
MTNILQLLFGEVHISYLKPAYTISFFLMIYIIGKFVINFIILKNTIKIIDNEFKQDVYNTDRKASNKILNSVTEGVLKVKKLLKEKIENPRYHIKEEQSLLDQKIHFIYIKNRNFYLGVIFISLFLFLMTFLFEIIEDVYLYLNKEEMLSSSMPFLKTVLEKVYFELCFITDINFKYKKEILYSPN